MRTLLLSSALTFGITFLSGCPGVTLSDVILKELSVLEPSASQSHHQYSFKISTGDASHAVDARLHSDGRLELVANNENEDERYTLSASPDGGMTILFEEGDAYRITTATGDGVGFSNRALLQDHASHSDPEVLEQPVRAFGYPFDDSGIHREVLEALRQLHVTHGCPELHLSFRDIYTETVILEDHWSGETEKTTIALARKAAAAIASRHERESEDSWRAAQLQDCRSSEWKGECTTVTSDLSPFFAAVVELPKVRGTSNCAGASVSATCEGTAEFEVGSDTSKCPAQKWYEWGWEDTLTISGELTASAVSPPGCGIDSVNDDATVGHLMIQVYGFTPLDMELASSSGDMCSTAIASANLKIVCCSVEPGLIWGGHAKCINTTAGIKGSINPVDKTSGQLEPCSTCPATAS